MSNLVGSTLGSHHILEQIGFGGMASVYIAYQPGLERMVAIKVLPELYAQNAKFMERFAQEARIIARLEHPNIIPIFDFATHDGLAYLTMRYVQAGTAKEILSRGPLSLADVSKIITDIASALDYAHAQGVIHRDVKPANILVDKTGHAYLTDFGIAKLLEATADLTSTGSSMGTPAYMAPEQTLNQLITPQTDVYSLGVMLYEMVTGHLPFDSETPMATALMHVNTSAPSIRHFNPGLPPALEAMIEKALAKEPGDRYATAGQLAQAFNAVVAATASAATEGAVSTASDTASSTKPPHQLIKLAAEAAADKHAEEVTNQVREIVRRKQLAAQQKRFVQFLPWAVGVLVILVLGANLFQARSDAEQVRIQAAQTSTAAIAELLNEVKVAQTAAARDSDPGARGTANALETRAALEGVAAVAVIPSSTFTPTFTATPTATLTATRTLRPPNTITPVPSPTTTLAFSLGAIPTAGPDEAGIVRGQVVYQSAPVANARVILRQTSTGVEFGTAITDANGQFLFQKVPPGSWVITATANDGLTSMFYGGYQIGPGCDFFIGRASFTRTFGTGKLEDANLILCMVRIGGFDITTPAAGSIFPGLIVSWNAVEGATNYDIGVQDITDPFQPPLAEDHLVQPFFDFTTKLGGDPTISGHCYQIRVMAFGGNGPITTTTTQACRQ
ncbi:MAG: protein kinase [Chloroflexi bacterium]|nr:protein kinase [Chloroflexota bacterium]